MDLQVAPKISVSLFLCAGCHAVEKMTRNSDALKRDVATRLLFFLVSARFCFDTDVGI